MTIRDRLSRAKNKVKLHLGVDSDNRAVAWAGLKTLLQVVEASSDVFPPLKSAVGGLNKCIDIFESASKGKKDYRELKIKLDTLLGDLSEHIEGATTANITMSMRNLCMGLSEEIALIEAKHARGAVQRHVEALDDSDEIMECYRRMQGHLERLTLNANLSIWRAVDKLQMEASLQKLPRSMSAVYNSATSESLHRRPCTPGTRDDEIVKIMNWVDTKTLGRGGSTYWMNGMAGTGKTTIAYSVCARLEETAKLGASFFCSRQVPECRSVNLIIPSVAYQLARFSNLFCCALMKVLESDPDIQARGLKTQFDNLLVQPLVEVQHTLPADLIVVIDALDECENHDSIGKILDVIFSNSSLASLPIRFLLSSRPEPQIYDRMKERADTNHNFGLVLHELDETKVKHDIETYLKTELKDVHLTPSQLAALVSQSGVLFIYASTAALYIKGGLPLGQHIARLNIILGLVSPPNQGKDRKIDALYTSILQNAFGNQDLDQSDRILMKLILDTIICAQEPLTTSGLSGLLRLTDVRVVEGFLRPLRSVINVSKTSGLVTTLHASFPDFMHHHSRSASLCCDIQSTHTQTARACFAMISMHNPEFNVCALRSSHLRDKEVPGLTARVDQAIPEQLFYACCYWMAHLEYSGEQDDLRELMNTLLSERLLLWMEVLNLKKSMHLGPRIMRQVENWVGTKKCPKKMKDLAHDAWRFVTAFAGHAVSQSTPHIYVSMLPCWPESAPIAKNYRKKTSGAINVKGSGVTRRQLALLATWSLPGSVWSICFSPDESLLACAVGSSVFILDGATGRTIMGPLDHNDTVTDVAFSNDGKRLVSCSKDKTLRLWNTSGHLMLDPLTGHTDHVNCLALCPNGEQVVSGSRDGTVRVWSLQSGRTVLGPLKSQNREVWSVCISPSRTRIASGHSDGAINVWDAESGQMLLGPLSGHTGVVESICFSPDNRRLVSGSRDKFIRIWNEPIGQGNIDTLEALTSPVYSIAFSGDGEHIASGSRDGTIRLWNIKGRPQLVRALIGHTNVVRCVRFSSDGARILSSSSDRTIRVWDALTQAPSDTPLQGHTQTVTSVVFSRDATRILSGSDDGTIYVWDAHTGQITVGPMKGHTQWVISVCFSPDQSRIVSGSGDKSIRVWDAYSGQAVGKPLTGHSGRVLSVCFSPDGGLVASCSEDKTIRLWDAQSGEAVGSPLKAHKGWVRSVCFSPDGLKIVSGSDDKSVLVWDINTRQPALPPLKGHTKLVWAVCVSPAGKCIASSSGDKTVRLWDAHSGRGLFGPLLGHTDEVRSIGFSPDGSYVVSGSWDKTIRLWDARSGQAVGSALVGHADLVRWAAFSPNGGQVVSGSADLSIRVWDVADLVQAKKSQGISDNVAKSSHARQSWALRDDGWIVDPGSRLLAWMPPDLHACLMSPRNTLLISTKGTVQLDFDSRKLGESWSECYKP